MADPADNFAHERWIIYHYREPLQVFLEKNRPSEVDERKAHWISVRRIEEDDSKEEVKEEEKDCDVEEEPEPEEEDDLSEEEEEEKPRRIAMLAEWNSLLENPESAKKVNYPETLKELAVKYGITVGKWLIFETSAKIDDVWFTIAKAVVTGKLGDSAKVSTKKTQDPKHVICVYTEDFTDETDVRRIEKALRDLNIHGFLQYKADIYTLLNIYKNNDLGIPPCIYRSEAVVAPNADYDHKEPLTSFLERNKPSQINDKDVNWINVSTKGHYDGIHSEQPEDSKHRVSAMKAEWHSLQEHQAAKKITPETLRELAVKYRITTGKWMIFARRDQVNDLWFPIAEAVLAGKLGSSAKVSSRKAHDPRHPIWVYTENFTDERDVRRVERALRELRIHDFMQYKADVYTILNIQRDNKLGIPPCVYRSEATRAQTNFGSRSHVSKNYDFSILKQFTN